MDFFRIDSFWTWLGAVGIPAVALVYTIRHNRKKDRADAPTPPPPPPVRKPTHMLGTMPRATDVLGRDALTDQIHIALRNRKKAVVAAGQGGIGKSTLARHYIAVHGDRYDGIVWVRAEDDTTLADDLCGIAVALKLDGLDNAKPEQQARAALNALPADQDWLIVYDNVQDPKRLSGWWPVSERARVLVTSRAQDWADVEKVEPETLKTDAPGDPGPQLLMREAGRRDDPEGARSLSAALGGLPLALVAAGGLIRDMGGSFAEYEAKLAQVLAEVPKGDYPDSVIGAVKLSYDALGDDARAVLDVFAWFAPEARKVGLPAVEPQEQQHVQLTTVLADRKRIGISLAALAKRSLLVRSGSIYILHRISAAALRALQTEAGRQEAVAWQAAALLAAEFPPLTLINENTSAAALPTPHATMLHQGLSPHVGDRQASEPVNYTADDSTSNLRQFAEFGSALALSEAEAELHRRRALLPSSHLDVAIGWSNLGLAYLSAGRLKDAVAAQAEAVRLSQAHDHGADTLAMAHNNHATALQALGRARGDRALLEQARVANTAALALRQDAFGTESDAVASSRSNLATHHAALGDLAAALKEATQALAIWRRVLPPGDARLGFAMNNTGSYHLMLGQAGAARPLLAEALALQHAAYGRDDHPNVVGTASWLVSCHLVLARRDPAQEAEARRIADAFGLDWGEEQRKAARNPGPVD